MKRAAALVSVAALVFSLASPTWTMCFGGGHRSLCHRVAARVDPCHGQAAEGPMRSSGSEASAQSTPDPCPMNCCTQARISESVAIPEPPPLPELASAGQKFDLHSIVFSINGFSSHTDRGPPLL